MMTLPTSLLIQPQQTNPENIDYDMYRSACIKEYELIIEQCGKLLRKVLKSYVHSTKEVDQLYFKVSTPPIPYYPPRQHRQLWIYFACNGFQFCGSNSFILLTG